MPIPRARFLLDEGTLRGRIAVATRPAGPVRAPNLDLAALGADAQALRATALAEDWGGLSRLGRDVMGRAHQGLLDLLHSSGVRRAALAARDSRPSRRAARTDGSGGMARDVLARPASLAYGHTVALLVDGLLARQHAEFNLRLAGRPSSWDRLLGREGLGAVVARAEEDAEERFRSIYGLAVLRSWGDLRSRLHAQLLEIPHQVFGWTRLAATLYGSPDLPFALPGGGAQRGDAAHAALRLHRANRWLVAAYAAAALMLEQASAGPEEPAPDSPLGLASRLAFPRARQDGVDMKIPTLLASPEAFEGKRVDVEGFMGGLREERSGGKYDSTFGVYPLSDGKVRRPGILVRGHFFSPTALGLGGGSYVRLTGQASVSHAWASGRPSLALSRVALAESPSWVDRVALAVRPWFQVHPRGVAMEWALAAQRNTAPGAPQGAGELIYSGVRRAARARPAIPPGSGTET
ncbi:hypothetical protein L6R50_19510 [Myxococcota bacterium]|nr:hypothetical protein [Myxococcota bacterium]